MNDLNLYTNQRKDYTMVFVDIDLSSEGFSPVPAATYRFRIDDSVSQSSTSEKNYGKPLIKWTFTILSPERVRDPLIGELVITAGKKLIHFTPAWAGAAGFLADLVRACGASLGGLGFDTKDLHGCELMGVVNTRVYKDKLDNDIERFYPAPKAEKDAPRQLVNDDDAPF